MIGGEITSPRICWKKIKTPQDLKNKKSKNKKIKKIKKWGCGKILKIKITLRKNNDKSNCSTIYKLNGFWIDR